MAFRVDIAPAAQRDLKKAWKSLPGKDVNAISNAISSLQNDPHPINSKKLSGGEALYRLRVGNYRIIYQIRESVALVLVLKLANRKDVYSRLVAEVEGRLKGYEK